MKLIVFLKFNDVFFTIIHGTEVSNIDDINHDNLRYYYEEHSCPTNFISVKQIIHEDGENDPHGLFEYWGCKLVDKIPDEIYKEDIPELSYKQKCELHDVKKQYDSFDKWENYIDNKGNYLDGSGSIFDEVY